MVARSFENSPTRRSPSLFSASRNVARSTSKNGCLTNRGPSSVRFLFRGRPVKGFLKPFKDLRENSLRTALLQITRVRLQGLLRTAIRAEVGSESQQAEAEPGLSNETSLQKWLRSG